MSMPLNDILALGLRNLRQAQLRTTLTVFGVLIGMAAIVSMVSFGLGLEEITSRQISKLDLFTFVTIQGPSIDAMFDLNGADGANSDEGRFKRALDDAGIAEVRKLANVDYVYPSVTFSTFARVEGHAARVTVAGVPDEAISDSIFQQLRTGRMFSKGTTNEVVVSANLLRRIRIRNADDALGKTLILLTEKRDEPSRPSLSEIASALQQTGPGNGIEETRLTIVGVTEGFAPVLGPIGFVDARLPFAEARRLGQSSRNSLQSIQETLTGKSGYPFAMLRVADITHVSEVREAIKKIGYRTQSITDGLDRIKNFFLILNVVLGLLGGLSLVVASFGIVNTLVMSILERTREIGVMKAIGADNGEVMRIFLVEASLIGFIGGAAGVAAGWALGRIANVLANRWIVSQGGTAQKLFAVPLWLVAAGVAFAVVVSLIAGVYPALRAARVDPIRALRHE